MTAQRFVHPLQQWFDLNGAPANGYRLYFYQTQTDTPLAVYSDEDLTTPITQPVVADSTGVFEVIFLQDAVYKVILNDSSDTSANGRLGVEIYSQDPYDATDPVQDLTSYYDLPIYIQGKPTAGETYPIFNAVRNVTLPANLDGSVFTVDTVPTATATFTLYKNGVSIGTIAFATSGVPTVTFLSNVNFVSGDQFSMNAPDPQDATGAYFAFTFVFTVN